MIPDPASPAGPGPDREARLRKFPEGFLWGAATAAHQVEGGNTNADWWRFERQPGRIHNGDVSGPACDFYNRYAEDFRLLRALRHNAHRLSIEWSRIEPRPGVFDPSQLQHYRDVLTEMRRVGLTSMVTLHHFTSPIWFDDLGNWAARGAWRRFLGYVERVVVELGDLVDLWCTINEPTVYATHGYLFGEHCPGRRGDLWAMFRVLDNMREAHERTYQMIRRWRPGARVGLAHHQILFSPAVPGRWLDRIAAAAAQGIMDNWPRGLRLSPILAASSDYIGINHYYGQLAAFDLRSPGQQFLRRSNPEGAELSDFGMPVVPAYLLKALLSTRQYRKPVYVTENGIAAADDRRRQRFLRDMLPELLKAIEAGVDLRGYFHWTSIDNFEWARGYSMKFGLIEVDRETMERRPKPSAHLFAAVAAANAIDW